MTMIAAPAISWRYWVMLCFASVLGADLGDLMSRELGLGYWRGLPVLAAVFIVVIVGARRAPHGTAWYWLAIVVVRAAATNLADWQALNEGDPPSLRFEAAFPVIIGSWGVLLALLALRDQRTLRDEPRGDADAWFWATMLAVGTLGTAVGDWLAFMSGTGLQGATALTTALLAVALSGLAVNARANVIAFWALVLVVRTWGTNVGDLSTDAGGSWLPFGAAAVLSLSAYVALYRSSLTADQDRASPR